MLLVQLPGFEVHPGSDSHLLKRQVQCKSERLFDGAIIRACMKTHLVRFGEPSDKVFMATNLARFALRPIWRNILFGKTFGGVRLPG
ncbi:hypothetical protein Y032_0002g897 [Ancylostoma ceylanicum]|uniref:Uncharacterized protein n=1 Tax=Ancylostoma ceylanicum TaxID=53326 RepID=A0A016W1V5_9BILA|nr:hypothetical protein Y032_0002g897 [Ancylostoma ceylanicum]